MQDENYDVSVFIIDQYNNYIYAQEYEKSDYIDAMFICLTNDELNKEYGFNNSIFIPKNWKMRINNTIETLKQGYNIKYIKQGHCKWQINDVNIPNNNEFLADIDWIDERVKRDSYLRQYLDGYSSCQNIMSNITSIKGKYTKEEYIPAIMTAYHTEVNHNGKTYKGYLPTIGQLLYISKNINNTNYALEIISNNKSNNFRLNNTKNAISGSWWSSTERTWNLTWMLHNGETMHQSKGDSYNMRVLPLFAL